MIPGADKKSIIIIGAGPIGIEAAVYAKNCGYRVRILEKQSVGGNIRQWQHVRLFSPFKLNYSPLGKSLLETQGHQLPNGGDYLTGADYLNSYLKPLADSALAGCVTLDCEVLAISRQGILKGDHIGNGKRKAYQFRILTRSSTGKEAFYTADVVIDASGSYGNHNWLGDGGIPAIGELTNRNRIQYGLEDIAGNEKEKYAGKTTLVIGSGHSAATSVTGLKQLMAENPATKLIWITRGNNTLPLNTIPGDVLAERERIVQEANDIVSNPNTRWIQNATIQTIEFDESAKQFRVEIETPDGSGFLVVDNIIANVGYSPDNSIYRELQVHECYASRGPMKLAAALLSENASADCLTQTSKGPDVLKNPEPDFYIIGMKSYGKNSNFLLKIGYEQIRDVFKLISNSEELNLYSQSAEAEPVAT